MANEQNLIPFSQRSESERKEIARKGGVASGEARRRKKAMMNSFRLQSMAIEAIKLEYKTLQREIKFNHQTQKKQRRKVEK